MEGVEFGAGKTVVPDQLEEKDPVRPIVVDFDRRMRARYGTGADQISGHGYDAVWLLSEALKRCEGKITRPRFRDALEATRDYRGCMGIYNYSPTDHDGLTKKDLVFIRIEGGRFKRLALPGFE